MDVEDDFDRISGHNNQDSLPECKLSEQFPSSIVCKVLHVLPQQVLVSYEWNRNTYKGLLWNISKG